MIRWTKADTADLLGFGLSTITCFVSGKSLAKDLDDFMAASTDLATLGSSVGCFVAGTVVKTEKGDKAIEEIEAGDKVLSYEATTDRFAYKEVTEVIAHDGVTELAHVTIDGETIDSTTNHPYFVVGYGYVDAGNLIEGDTVLLANGKEGKVEKVEIEFLTEPVTVYNFEVKDWHCYFVGEAGVLVHNASCVNTSGTGNTGGNTNGNSGGRNTTDALYHYTTKEGAEAIQKSGVIKADNRGRVFVTTDQIPPDEVNNALFMGRKPESGTHIVEIYLNDPSDINLTSIGATQPNELIYNGSIRNGRNATLVIKENGY